MKNIKDVKILFFKRKIYFNILKFFGVCSACFVFEACYGVPRNEVEPTEDFNFSGYVLSQDSTLPIANAKVEIKNNNESETVVTYTNSNGYYKKSVTLNGYHSNISIKAYDSDSVINGLFLEQDTLVNISSTEINEKNKMCNISLKRKKS